MVADTQLLRQAFQAGGAAYAAALTPAQWADLLGQARTTRLGARLASHLASLQGVAGVPPGAWRHLKAEKVHCARQMLFMRWEVHRVRDALVDLAGPVLLLKGAAYLMLDLPAAEGRLFADIDVMVPRSSLASAEAALMQGGWVPVGLDNYDDRYYRDWMHELPPLTHVARGSVIDLHHTITPPTSSFRVAGESLIAAARPLERVPGLWVLQPVDMVLHSAVHLFAEGEFERGMRDLMDLQRLLLHFSRQEPDFWLRLFERTDELGLRTPLHHALVHVQRLFGQLVPAAHALRVDALAPDFLRRHLMGGLLALALRPHHPSCRVPGERLARWLLYIRSHWLRMPLRLLAPHLLRKAWRSLLPPRQA